MNNSQKISVLHLISSADFLGAERVVCELASNADSNRFHMYVGLLGSSQSVVDSFKAALEGSAAELIYFQCSGKFSLSCIRNIQLQLRTFKIDILHSHGYKSDLYVFCATKFTRTHFRLIATNHTWKLRTLSERIYKFIDKTLLKMFDVVVAVSDEVREELIRLGVTKNRISLINNGVSVTGYDPVNRFTIRRELGISPNELIIGCIASLTVEKAHADLIRAFAIVSNKVPHVRLVLVGDGPELANLVSLTEEFRLNEEIVFAGKRQDVKSLYTACDIFALVSYAEGLPMAMLEAMAASLPVVVSSVGAIPQVISPMKNGILVTPGDINGIADIFIKLAVDPELRQLLGKNARNEVVSNYSVNRMAQDYEQLYEKTMENHL